MKKYILILFLLISSLANAQWATPERLPRTTVVNTGTFYGKGAGTVNAPIQMIVSPGATIDTASWRFVGSGGDGSNKVMVNRVTYLGRAAGTVYATLVYGVNSASSIDTSNVAFLDQSNTFTGNNKFAGHIGIGSSLFTFGSSTLTLSGANFYSGTIGASDLTVGHELNVTGASITGFNAVKINVDTITAPDEVVNIYGGLNILSGGYQIYGGTENQNITFTRHFPDGDLSAFTIGSTGATISYFDSTANVTTALKVGNGTITANDSALATRNWVSNNFARDSSLFVKRSAFSQSIEATGGNFNFDVPEGAMNFTADGPINFMSGGDITFNGADFQGPINLSQTVNDGGVTPATVGKYITISVNGVLYDFWVTEH